MILKRDIMEKLKKRALNLKKETYILYNVYKDARVARWKRFFLALVIGYAFCPIDLIPDFIPILGYLDDLILVPVGISIALKLIPTEIMDEHRKNLSEVTEKDIPVGKKTAIFIVFLWIIGFFVMISWLINLYLMF